MYLRTVVSLGLVVVSLGCVERTVTITTEPSGALVWLNDKEVGRTPLTESFQWYGDYDVVIRKEGFKTLKTHEKLKAPWYQYPPIDFFAEILTPATIHDDHAWYFQLERSEPVSQKQLLERAAETKAEAAEESGGEDGTDQARAEQKESTGGDNN